MTAMISTALHIGAVWFTASAAYALWLGPRLARRDGVRQ